MIDADTLRALLHYDAETGVFTWRARSGDSHSVRVFNGKFAGKRAGQVISGRYRAIRIKTKLHQEHALAWLYVYGVCHLDELDHINGDPADNRLDNLRPCTAAQNKWNVGKRANNTSGFKGVYKSRGRWFSAIAANKRNYYLGTFPSAEAAAAAYQAAAIRLHGEFCNLGDGHVS